VIFTVISDSVVSYMRNRVLVAGPRHRDQDQDGNDGPDDFGQGVVAELRRDRTLGLAEREHRIAHGAEHQHADDHANAKDEVVQPVDLVRDRRDAGRHVELPGLRIGGRGHPGRQHRHQPDSQTHRLSCVHPLHLTGFRPLLPSCPPDAGCPAPS
jgi:hypothetical protein